MNKAYLRAAHFELYDRFVPPFRLAYVIISIMIIMFSNGFESFRLTGFIGCLFLALLYSLAMLFFKKFRRLMAYEFPPALFVIDLIFVSLGIVTSGGVFSDFYLIYILFVSFYALAYDLKYSMIVCTLCSASYLTTLWLMGGFNLLPAFIRVFFFFSFAAFTGILSARLSQYKIKLATHDGLTSLYNRQFLYNALENEILKDAAAHKTTTLAFFDVDHFKEINDEMGHIEGDRILAVLGEIIKENIRAKDIAARYGGDEFALILPDTDKDGALALCERIQKDLKLKFDGKIVISIGCSTYPFEAENVNDLFRAADIEMYKDKSKKILAAKKHVRSENESILQS